MLEERERMVFEFGRMNQIPIGFVLAGGYTNARLTEEWLVDLHRMTIIAASGRQWSGNSRNLTR